MKKRRRILPLFAGALSVLAASGALYQAIASAIDRRTYPRRKAYPNNRQRKWQRS